MWNILRYLFTFWCGQPSSWTVKECWLKGCYEQAKQSFFGGTKTRLVSHGQPARGQKANQTNKNGATVGSEFRWPPLRALGLDWISTWLEPSSRVRHFVILFGGRRSCGGADTNPANCTTEPLDLALFSFDLLVLPSPFPTSIKAVKFLTSTRPLVGPRDLDFNSTEPSHRGTMRSFALSPAASINVLGFYYSITGFYHR